MSLAIDYVADDDKTFIINDLVNSLEDIMYTCEDIEPSVRQQAQKVLERFYKEYGKDADRGNRGAGI